MKAASPTKDTPLKPVLKENLRQRAYLNSITTLFNYGAGTITGFVVTPFLVSGLGSTLFGIWQILGQFTAYTNLADIRATQVLKWAVARDRETVSEDVLRQYVTASFIIVLFMLPLVLIAGSFIAWYAPMITKAGEEYTNIVRFTCLLLVLAIVIDKVADTFDSVLRGMNLGFKLMGIFPLIMVAAGGLKIMVIVLGFGLIGIAVVQVIVSLIIGTILYIIVKKSVPWFGFGKVNLNRVKSFLKTSGWFIGWTGAKILLTNSDKILLGYIAGPIMVTQYVITKYLANTVQGLITNIIHGVIPGLGKLYGNGAYERLFKAREHMMLITWIFAVSIGTLVLVFNESFLIIWIGEGKFAGGLSNILIVIMITQYMFIQNDAAIIQITLDLKQQVYFSLTAAMVSIGLSMLLIERYGIAGLCIAIISGRFIATISYPWIVYAKTNKKFSTKSIPYRLIFSTLIIWGGAYSLSKVISIHSWLMLIGSVFILFPFVIVLLYFTSFSKRQRNEISNYAYKIEFRQIIDR